MFAWMQNLPELRPFDLKAFQRRASGVWTAIAPAKLIGPQGPVRIAAGTTFQKGQSYSGIDVVAWLEYHYGKSQAASARP